MDFYCIIKYKASHLCFSMDNVRPCFRCLPLRLGSFEGIGHYPEDGRERSRVH